MVNLVNTFLSWLGQHVDAQCVHIKVQSSTIRGSIVQTMRWISQNVGTLDTWWLIPLSKWVITPVINGTSRVNPLITGVITHLLSGMNHLVEVFRKGLYRIRWKLLKPVETCWNPWGFTHLRYVSLLEGFVHSFPSRMGSIWLWGYSNSWMVSFMENPPRKRWI